ncbi:MAG: PspC domain-containing protein [Acidimicrobiales bacterium]
MSWRRDHQGITERTNTGATPPPTSSSGGPDARGPQPDRPSGDPGTGAFAAGPHGPPRDPTWADGSFPPWVRYSRHNGWSSGGGPWPRHGHHGRGPGQRARDRGPIRRSRDERLIAGVSGGLARRLGWDPTVVRVVTLMVSLSGFGACVYVLAWLFVPAEGETQPIFTRSLSDRTGILLALAFVPAVAIALLVGSALGASWVSSLALPALVSAAGLVLIWRNADPVEQEFLHRGAAPVQRLFQPSDGSGRAGRLVLRVLVAAGLLVGGLVALQVRNAFHSAVRPLGGLLLIIAAIVTVFGPWWLRVARELVVERQARARAEERAELAARVHDSVLQTLALIQRRADQPQQVVQLARAQERELRSWLFDGERPGSAGDHDASFAAGVHRIQEDVEILHGVAVEVVVVGDCDLDDGLRAMLAAGREAAVNAAKWSGAPSLALFGEVEEQIVSLFVRDRGIGFDPAVVSDDRKGIAESIRGRMARQGGTVAIRSSPGAGTEVALSMQREPGRRIRSSAAT